MERSGQLGSSADSDSDSASSMDDDDDGEEDEVVLAVVEEVEEDEGGGAREGGSGGIWKVLSQPVVLRSPVRPSGAWGVEEEGALQKAKLAP